MALITGITGAAADPEVSASDELGPDLPVQGELFAESEAEAGESDDGAVEPVEAESVEEPSEPGPNLEERSYTLIGRVMRMVMKTISPGAWQSVVQQMAGQMPEKIELKPVAELSWDDQKHCQELLEELHDQGFVDAGIFYAEAMDTKMKLMLNDAYDIRAVIYERANSGVVLDLVTLYGDGTGVTYVNRPDPGFAQSPLHPNVYMGQVPVYELLDKCLRERPKKAILPACAETAPRLTELEYEFGAKRLRGEPVNPIEIAEAYLELIERLGTPKDVEQAVSAVLIEEHEAVVSAQENESAKATAAGAVGTGD